MDIYFSHYFDLNVKNRQIDLTVDTGKLSIIHHLKLPFNQNIEDQTFKFDGLIKVLICKITEQSNNIIDKGVLMSTLAIEDINNNFGDGSKFYLYFIKNIHGTNTQLGILGAVFLDNESLKSAVGKFSNYFDIDIILTSDFILENQSGIIKI